MIIAIIILSILTIASLLVAVLTMRALFDLQEQHTLLYKMYKGVGIRLRPIRLKFLYEVYNNCVECQEYETASEIKEIIESEYPDEYKKSNRQGRSGSPASWML